ncbi:hypothetical protein C8R45DRAFT_833132, partial [Mycena sanguinolenta]
ILLYDERGLRLYDDVIHSPEYYLFGAEAEILKEKSGEIVALMHASSKMNTNVVVLEVSPMSAGHPDSRLIRFQLSLRTLSEISLSEAGKYFQGNINIRGLCATYEQGLRFAASGALHARTTAGRSFPDDTSSPLHIWFLGSSLGNFSRTGGAALLRSFPLRPGSSDRLLLGLDHDTKKTLIEAAYNDREGRTKRFVKNGLKAAGRVLGDENLVDEENWEYGNVSGFPSRFPPGCIYSINGRDTTRLHVRQHSVC